MSNKEEYKIPNLKKILQPDWSHKLGYGINQKGWHKQNIWSQGTIPEDLNLLKKLGFKKGEKILAIAGYYGDWASAIKKSGTRVDYSDISKPIVNYVKKQKDKKFDKYICSGYEVIPKKAGEYDWTFTYEACGGGQGLTLAYLRALLNNKGGILVLNYTPKNPKSMGSKIHRYPKIIKNLAKVYHGKYYIVKKKIKSHGKKEPIRMNTYFIYKILTNNFARKKAELDLKVLWEIKNKKVISQKYKDSIKRLNILSKSLADKFRKKIILK